MKRFKTTMRVMIGAIGGEFTPGVSGDELVGTAHDPLTALRLIDYVELKKGYAVSLHGDGLEGMHALSGTVTLQQARDLFRLQHHRVEVAEELARARSRKTTRV